MSDDEITFDFALPEPELFAVETVAMDSPRLAWLKRHKVFTHRRIDHPDESPWCAWCEIEDQGECLRANGPRAFVYGETEDDALGELAIGRGWGLWNEEAR